MKSLIHSKRVVQPRDEVVRYAGEIAGLSDTKLLEALADLTVAKALISWLPSGVVQRDADETFEWARWYCRLQQSQFDKEHIDNCRLVMRLIADRRNTTANLIFRMEPIEGEGSVSYRATITRIGHDDYLCFEA